MRFIFIITAFLFLATSVRSQKKLDKVLEKLNKESVPYIQVEELSTMSNVILLDTRKKEEFNVSHLKDAVWVGYKHFEIELAKKSIPNANSTIVVYCSIGVRSEDIGEKLLKAGFNNVHNLYGGIFEWKEKGNIVVDDSDNETQKVHVYSKHWGKLLTNAVKVY
ncbi:MAG: rhodanese [Flavobacteriaceae bacterium]|nr:MAG: rhodanese [Flavobacteriaceae bacterium]